MKILITGSNGLVGNALKIVSAKYPEHDYIFADRSFAELTEQKSVEQLYQKYQPDYVIHTAARVGGIGANLAKPAQFFYENILMNSFIIHYAHLFNVKKLLCFSSVCSFPDGLPVLKEEYQQEGKPYEANAAYGYSKRMVDVQINAYRKQHNSNFCTIIPGNIFGPNDNYELSDGHVVPSLIHKCFVAKRDKQPLRVWGNGSPLREFIYSVDLADITFKLLFCDKDINRVLVSNNIEISIKDMVFNICNAMDFKGEIIFDASKPQGQYRRPSDISLLKSLIPDVSFSDHKVAIQESVNWFVNNYPNLRK